MSCNAWERRPSSLSTSLHSSSWVAAEPAFLQSPYLMHQHAVCSHAQYRVVAALASMPTASKNHSILPHTSDANKCYIYLYWTDISVWSSTRRCAQISNCCLSTQEQLTLSCAHQSLPVRYECEVAALHMDSTQTDLESNNLQLSSSKNAFMFIQFEMCHLDC